MMMRAATTAALLVVMLGGCAKKKIHEPSFEVLVECPDDGIHFVVDGECFDTGVKTGVQPKQNVTPKPKCDGPDNVVINGICVDLVGK